MYLDSNNNKLYKCKANTDNTSNTSSLFDLYSISNLVDNPDVCCVHLPKVTEEKEYIIDCQNAKYVFIEPGLSGMGAAKQIVNLSKIINRDNLIQLVFLKSGASWNILEITNFYYRSKPNLINSSSEPQNKLLLSSRYANAVFYVSQDESHRNIFYSHSFNAQLTLVEGETP